MAVFRYIRWTISKRRGNSNSIQVAELQMRLGGTLVPWNASRVTTNPGGSNPVGEPPLKATDGDVTTTKWLDFAFNGGSTSQFGTSVLHIDNITSLEFDGYSYVTANDAFDRDPISWTLEGSPDNVAWTLLSTVADAAITAARLAQTQTFSAAAAGPSTVLFGLTISGSGTVSGGATTGQLRIATQPGGARTGVVFATQPVVEARNTDGTLDTAFTGTVTMAIDAGVGVLSGTVVVNAVAGIATFTDLIITGKGKHVLVATANAGLTATYSGVMSVLPPAPTAGTHLDYTGSSSARYLDAGSAVAIPDDTTIVSVFRPHSNATGGARLYQRNAPVATDRLVFAFSPSGTFLFVRSRATQDALFVSNAGAFSTETIVKAAVTHDSVGGVGQFFAGVVGAGPMSAITLATNQPGSGTLDAPTASPARMWGGDIGADSVGYGTMKFNRVLTREECDQAAALIMDQARDYTVRPVPISGCIGFWQDGRDGVSTVIDRSGAGHNGTVVGAPAAVGGVVLYAPQVWAHSTDPVDQGDYWQPTSHAEWSVITDATQMEVHLHRTLVGFEAQNALAVLVNGVYSTQVVVAAAGPHTATVTLPVGVGKLITFVNGVQSRAGAAGVGDPEISVGLVSAVFNAAAAEVIPATPSLHAVSLHDSIFDGFVADPVGQRGVIEQLRTLLPGYGVTSIGYGGHTLFKVATSIAARDALVATVRSIRPQILLVHLGLNDYSNSLWNATNYGNAYADLLVRLFAAMPTLRVQLVTPVTLATGEGANGLGSTVAAYRTAAVNAASGHSGVTVSDGPSVVWNGVGLGDAVHPNNTSSDSIAVKLAGVIVPPAGNKLFRMAFL